MNLIGDSRSCTLGFRERQFMRQLVQNDYLEGREFICQQQLEIMSSNPEALVVTHFDYTIPPVQLSVRSLTDDDPIIDTLNGMGAEWMDYVSRAERSGGRMQLHVMQVSEGVNTSLDDAATSEFFANLRCRLGTCGEPLSARPVLENKVSPILGDTVRSNLVEIH
ncbi:hypothetical protein C8R45DRAFT_943461 [Mycena sanguinolenta]|nr:hypothetical protein C8R45DRAFT_943461 [Mycena sanguinolenta]